MFTVTKRTLTAVAVIAAASAPSTAYARFELSPTPSPAWSEPAQTAATQSAPRPEASPSQGFQWDDAGIGAAGMLGLLGAAGASAALSHRRRDRTPVS